MKKKIIILGIISLIGFLAFGKPAHAQCNTFDFPFVKNGDIFFYNCELGEIQKFDKQNALVSVPGMKKIGGFVHNFIWSPDGTKALILAENVAAAVQNLEFFSPEREINSLNWWAYNLSSGEAGLLDKNIISIGWNSNSEIVWNWNNENFSTAKMESLIPKNTAELSDIQNDVNDINEIVSPISLNGITVFPMKKGFYAINAGKKEIKYFSLGDEVQKILANPFGQTYFFIKSGNSLYKFSVSGNNLEPIDKNFSASDFAFLDNDLLVTVENGGRAFSYIVNDQSKTEIKLPISGGVSRVFSVGNRNEFIFVIGNNIYKKNMGDEAVLQLGQGKEAIMGPHRRSSPDEGIQEPAKEPGITLTPVDEQQAQATSPAPQRNNNIVLLIVGILLIAIGVALYFVYKKFIKNPTND